MAVPSIKRVGSKVRRFFLVRGTRLEQLFLLGYGSTEVNASRLMVTFSLIDTLFAIQSLVDVFEEADICF